jgi:2-polyprenyl-3-methyl-5-hydroxy-6-metoxy-1,4-benzoquinol methylase
LFAAFSFTEPVSTLVENALLARGACILSADQQLDRSDQASAMEAMLSERLAAVIGRITVDKNADAIARSCGLRPEQVRLLLATYCNEARVGLQLIAPSLHPGLRVLEVGTGVGLLASLLSEREVDIVGIEPGNAGFGFMPALASLVTTTLAAGKPFAALPIGVAELDPTKHGVFDLIYSVNVVEHLRELEIAMAAMSRVLSPGGMMVHMCPNYTVPYEPHLLMPLIPWAPRLTARLFPARVQKYPGLWDDLNFVTTGRLRRLAAQNGLAINFDKGVMGAMMRRVLTDPVLAERQGPLVRGISSVMQRCGALTLIDQLPAALATPMIARLTKP